MEKEYTAPTEIEGASIPLPVVDGKSPIRRGAASMNLLSKAYYRYKKLLKVIRLFLIIAAPGIIVMVADNDAGVSQPIPQREQNSVSI